MLDVTKVALLALCLQNGATPLIMRWVTTSQVDASHCSPHRDIGLSLPTVYFGCHRRPPFASRVGGWYGSRLIAVGVSGERGQIRHVPDRTRRRSPENISEPADTDE